MPFWLGPPLPRVFGLYWPWLSYAEEEEIDAPGIPVSQQALPSILQPQTVSTYNNEERWEIKWNADGLPEQIIVHRHATKDQEK